MPRYAEVVVPRHLRRSFTYSIPDHLAHTLSVGDAVIVPFGSVTVRGMVVAIRATHTHVSSPHKLRRVLSVCRERAPSSVERRLLKLARWIADYYLTPLGQCLRLILPPEPTPARAGRYVLTDAGQEALTGDQALGIEERALLRSLARRAKGASLSWLQKQVPAVGRGRLTHAVEQGWLELVGSSREFAKARSGQDRADRTIESADGPSQELETQWRNALASALQAPGQSSLLVEAFPDERMAALLAAVTITLETGRQAIVIAPEVRRVKTLGAALGRRWGAAVELWHGERSPKERSVAWHRVRSGEVRIVVGTRTAVLAPLDQVGLICVEDEDHGALKEEQEPRFHAREVAWHRAELEPAAVLLLSSQASLETRIRLQRGGGRMLPAIASAHRLAPPVEVVVLDQPPRNEAISPLLEAAIRDSVGKGQRVALYLNRRGYAPALVCGVCGAVPRCPQCQVALLYSQEARLVRCRTCGWHAPAPDHCHACHGTHFDLVGYGTERLEAEVKARFPGALVYRVDRDAALRRRAEADVARPASSKPWNIAIGTRLMLGEIPPCSCALVGIVYAEAGLHVPDFRASERTYQELWQVVQLADAAIGGRAIVQTCLPAHPVMRALAIGAREAFDREEVALREALEYPPFASMVTLEAVGVREDQVRETAGRWARLLRRGIEACPTPAQQGVMILGPVQAGPLRLRGRSRWRLMVKGQDGARVRSLVRSSLEQLAEEAARLRVKLCVDVDPLNPD